MALTVQFFGICTHMAFPQPGVDGSLAWGRRMVLINASNPSTITGNPFLNSVQPPIQPHFAQLQLRADQIVSMETNQMPGFVLSPPSQGFNDWSLGGVIFSIPNETPPGSVEPMGEIPGIPSLQALSRVGLSPTNLDVTLRANAESGAAAYFDLFTGTWEAQAFVEAAVAVATVPTNGLPQLQVRSFLTDEIILITLEEDAVVAISNLEDDASKDNDNDFLLHYLAASTFPAPPLPNTPPPSTSQPLSNTTNIPLMLDGVTPYAGATPGCSNSTYP